MPSKLATGALCFLTLCVGVGMEYSSRPPVNPQPLVSIEATKPGPPKIEYRDRDKPVVPESCLRLIGEADAFVAAATQHSNLAGKERDTLDGMDAALNGRDRKTYLKLAEELDNLTSKMYGGADEKGVDVPALHMSQAIKLLKVYTDRCKDDTKGNTAP